MLDILAFKACELPVKNEITNGDFNGEGGWATGSNIVDFTILEGIATFTGAGNIQSTAQNWVRADVLFDKNDVLYNSIEAKHNGVEGSFYIGVGYNYKAHQLTSSFERYSIVNNSSIGGNSLPSYGAASSVNVSIKNAIAINLTQVFGAGNEPTVEQMDILLSKFPYSWFDGTKSIFSGKQLLNTFFKDWTRLDNAITALGGGS